MHLGGPPKSPQIETLRIGDVNVSFAPYCLLAIDAFMGIRRLELDPGRKVYAVLTSVFKRHSFRFLEHLDILDYD